MADKKLLQLTISRVDGPLFDGNVEFVTVPGELGEMTILANHEAFVSPLKNGNITVKNSEGTLQSFEAEFGIIEVSDNQATILL